MSVGRDKSLLTVLKYNLWFVQKAPKELVRRAHDVTFIPVLNIVLRSDDNSELQVS